MGYRNFLKVLFRYNIAKGTWLHRNWWMLLWVVVGSMTFFKWDYMRSPWNVSVAIVSWVMTAFISFVNINPPKQLFVQSLSEKDLVQYVNRGYWLRFVIALVVYVVVSLTVLVLKKVSIGFFIVGMLSNLMMMCSYNELNIINTNFVGNKQKKILRKVYYDPVEITLSGAFMTAGFMFQVTGPLEDDIYLNVGFAGYFVVCMTFLIFVLCVVGHYKRHKVLIEECASFEFFEKDRELLKNMSERNMTTRNEAEKTDEETEVELKNEWEEEYKDYGKELDEIKKNQKYWGV